MLDPVDAASLWHRAGALTAAAVGFGLADLHGGNLPVGRGGGGELFFYPVDLEVFFAPINRLADTGLVFDPAAGPQHHVGFECTPRWCAPEVPPVCWFEPGLRLGRLTDPYARSQTRSVVADSAGRTGYGPYLTSLLRGMFDAWTLMCRNRQRIAELLDREAGDHHVRVIHRPTAVYTEFLAGRGDDTFDEAERRQLRRHDVPYFFRAAHGGPLLATSPGEFHPAPVVPEPEPRAMRGPRSPTSGKARS